MIAYNHQYLDNRSIQAQASEALAKKIITAEENQHIRASYPYHFYTPNIYIRVGLFLLTVVILLCCLGLFMLGGVSSEKGMGTLLIFFGVVSYAALEFFIYDRKVYRSGLDDALLWTASGLVLIGINLCANHINASMESLIVFLLATAGVLRYADHGMALVAYGACLSIQKKDVIFLWAGLALIAAAIFTVRYYYHVLPAELAMIIGGCVLIGTAYGLIRYLRSPKYGLTSIASDDPHLLEKLHIEALVLAETFQSVTAQPTATGVRFGGGSGGGGGATGEF
jgi:hypothetical protein